MGAMCLLLAGWCNERAEVANFTESLAKLRSEFRTIQIDFTLTRVVPVFQTPWELSGRFVLLREKDGTLHGVLQFVPERREIDKETWVLRGEDLYCYDERIKTVTKHTAAKDGVLEYVASVWPGVWLLDRDEARARCQIALWKKDANYTYFKVNLKDGTRYRFAVLSRDRSIRQIFVEYPSGTTEQLKVTRWAVDAAEGVSANDFPDPTRPPAGWTSRVWPGRKSFWKHIEAEMKARQSK